MATRAEQFENDRRQNLHTGARRPAPSRKNSPAPPEARNLAPRVDRKASAVLEDAPNGKPSRKSTRKSSHHGRQDVAKQKVARWASESPGAKATQAQAKRTRARGGSR